MAVWVVKAGRMGEREQRILEHGVVAIGWEELGDLSNVQSRESLKDLYKKTYPWASEGNVNMNVGQIWAFLHRMDLGELVVTPIKTRSQIAVGTIKSGYKFTNEFGPDMLHIREVAWIRTDLPRTGFDRDLLASFAANPTVCQVTRNDAEARIRTVIEGGPEATPGEDIVVEDISQQLDLEEIAGDQIVEHVERHFKGHDLARLVEGVLQAQGYVTKASPPGPDGGVDILAGKGPIGLDSPRVCVQVKSSSGHVDVEVYRALRGTMQAFGAEQGLLVGWGGFTSSTMQEARNSYFVVKLWDKADLIDAILRHYDQLPPDVQTRLPLERMWHLALPSEEER